MIVVVEGPSGAGKTTWCIRHCGPHALLEALPDHAGIPTEPEAEARFWVERNVTRWNEVLERERRDVEDRTRERVLVDDAARRRA